MRALKFSTLAFFVTWPLLAQSIGPTVHSAADLAEIETKLTSTADASPAGVGLRVIDDFGSSQTLLVVRVHTGDAELHGQWADQMVIVKGTATLVTGGSLKGSHALPNQPGEIRGSSLEGGEETILHAGDIAHIPAGVPHWIKTTPKTNVTYLVFKER